MSQRTREQRSRRLRLFASTGSTLLLGFLLILSFAWGGLAADSNSGWNLAQGREPVATTNANGEVFVLWERPQGGLAGKAIDAWGDPRGLEFPIPGLVGGERRPAAAWLDDDQVVIAWESPASGSDVQVQQFGYRLGDNFLVSSGEPIELSEALYPALAADEDGFAVAWTSVAPGGPNGQHFLAFFDRQPQDATLAIRGRRLGDNFRVGQPGAVTPPGIAVAEGTGAALVVWENAGKDIMAVAFRDRARLGDNFRINASREGQQSSPAVTATLDGNFLVVWESRHPSGGERQIYGSRVAGWGRRLGDNFRITSAPSFAPQRPSLAADPWGRQIVIWSQGDPSEAAIMAQSIFLDGTANGPAFRVDSGDPFPGAPRVTRGGQGTDFIVLWENDETSENPDIRVRFLTGPYELEGDDE